MVQRRTSVSLPAQARRTGPACCRSGPCSASGAGAAAQVQVRMRYGCQQEQLKRLTNCEAALIAFEQAAGRAHRRLPPPPRSRSHFSRQVLPTKHSQRSSAGGLGPGGGACRGPVAALLVALLASSSTGHGASGRPVGPD